MQFDNPITQYRLEDYSRREPETLDWIDRWVKDGDTFIDVGANVGAFSLYAAMRHPGVRVIALEPEYANLHLLRDNVMKNGLQDRVEVYAVALGKQIGISYLHIQDATPGAALHTESKERLTTTRTHKPVIWREGVCTFTLDALCEELQVTPQCLKIDVDGTEPEILQGATRTLRAPVFRSLIVEMFGGPSVRASCGELLRAAGLRREWAAPETSENELWVRT
ncbi:MAG TPA: hypothetical protein DDX89_07370 [Candidatus Omnitrophica bacterium]|nr:hypothetical protein [Candidatus Omnitrophota bacterium]